MELDDLILLVREKDIKKKTAAGNELLKYLSGPSVSVKISCIGELIEGLISCINCNNSKISQNGLDATCLLIDKIGSDLKEYINCLLPCILVKFGDGKEALRSRCQMFLLNILKKDILSLADLIDSVKPLFTGKNSYAKEAVLGLFIMVFSENNKSRIKLNSEPIYKLLPYILKLFCDQNAPVRDKAKETLLYFFKEIGMDLKAEIEKNGKSIPSSRLSALFSDFDKINPTESLLLKISKTGQNQMRTQLSKKEVAQNTVNYESFATKFKPNVETNNSCKKANFSSTKKIVPSKIKSTKKESHNNSAGAVNEELFLKSFEEVPKLHKIYGKELVDGMKKIINIISNQNEDWDKQVDALKSVRSYIIAGGHTLQEFSPQLYALQTAIQMSVSDLRSQVVREACVTIAFLSKSLSNKCEHFAECMIPLLLNLIQSSVKVISSSGQICIKFVLKYIHSHRLIPIIISHLSYKSKAIRKSCCEFLNDIVHNWPTQCLERHSVLIQEAIKNGITDADGDARVYSRKAYWCFRKHFPELSESILKSLGESHKRALALEMNLANKSYNPDAVINSDSHTSFADGQCFDTYHSLDEGKEKYIFHSKSDTNLQVCQSNNFQENITIRKKIRTKLFSAIDKQQPSKLNYSNSKPEKFLSKSQPCSRSCSPSHKWNKKGINIKNLNLFCTLSKSNEQTTALEFRNGTECSNSAMYNVIYQNSKSTFNDDYCNQQSKDIMIYEKKVHNIAEIIKKCESSKHPTEIKEALDQIKTYIQDGNVLKFLELSYLQEICIRLFENTNTKVSSSFFTTLDVFIATHFSQLTVWFHVILTKLITKLGESLLDSLECKIHKCFDTIIKVFPISLQVSSVFNFVSNHAAISNEKVKIAACYYIKRLINERDITVDLSQQNTESLIIMDSSTSKALTEIIKWTNYNSESKKSELPTIATYIITHIFSLNSPYFTQIFKQLASQYQIWVTDLIQEHVLSLNICNLSHCKSDNSSANTELAAFPLCDDSENTSEEKFAMQDDVFFNNVTHFDCCEIKNLPNNENSLEGKNDNVLADSESKLNKCISSAMCDTDRNEEWDMDKMRSSLRMKEVVDLLRLSIIKDDTNLKMNSVNANLEKNEMFEKLIKEIRKSSHIVIKDNFKPLLKILLNQLGNCEPSTNILALNCLTEMMKIEDTTDIFDNYVEFIVLKVLQAFKDRTSDIHESAEICLMTIGKTLTPGLVIRVLVPTIINGDYPFNFAAIKALDNIIKVRDKTYIQLYLNYIFPAVKEAYDHEEKSVRKSALMCLVALDTKLGGEELKPYLNLLHENKLKLYQMYTQQEGKRLAST